MKKIESTLLKGVLRRWCVGVFWGSLTIGGTVHASVPDETIKVGILHSLSGTMSISESSVVESTLVAIDEINQSGGVLGKKIEPVIADGASNWDIFHDAAKKLVTEDKVKAVFGCWTSASRKSVKSVFEDAKNLLFYPVQYEGLEQSPNIVYTGAAPNQQLSPAMTWAATQGVKSVLLVGSDYVFPRSANAILKYDAAAAGIAITDELYVPLGSNDINHIITSIKTKKPDMIFNTINGDTNIALFKELKDMGYNASTLPVVSFSIGEPEIQLMNLDQVQGHYAVWNYFQSLQTPENKKFISLLAQKPGIKISSDPMEAAYFGVHLWAQAVAEAKSAEPMEVKKHLSQSYQAPSGIIKIDPATQHVHKTVYLGKINKDKQFDIVWNTEAPVAPQPYPAYHTKPEWEKMLSDLYTGWGNHWAFVSAPVDVSKMQKLIAYAVSEEPYMFSNLSNYGVYGTIGSFMKNILLAGNVDASFAFVPKSRAVQQSASNKTISFPLEDCETEKKSSALWTKTIGLGLKKDKKLSDVKSVAMVKGAFQGGALPKKIAEAFKGNKVEINYVSSIEQSVQMVFNNRIDAVVIDETQLSYLLSINPFYSFALTFDIVNTEPMEVYACFASSKDRDQFNQTLSDYKQSNVISFPMPAWR